MITSSLHARNSQELTAADRRTEKSQDSGFEGTEMQNALTYFGGETAKHIMVRILIRMCCGVPLETMETYPHID